MLTKPEIACAIIEGIASVKADFQDLVIEVEAKEFKCHRLILSACSGFFRGFIRSGRKKLQKQRIKLESVSKETFSTILETLYTGIDNLTPENMLNVWLAANQLQISVVFDNCIQFITKNICNKTVISVWKVASKISNKNIVQLCEIFLRNNISLENWGNIYSTANMLGSDLILSDVRDFIKKNYEQVIKSNTLLCLHEKDLLEIIKSQDLIVTCEDVVIDSILYWVNNGTINGSEIKDKETKDNASNALVEQDFRNQRIGEIGVNIEIKPDNVKEARKKSLERLLSETRLYLVNSTTLEKLSCNALVMDTQSTRDMVMDAFLNKCTGRQHDCWSKAAIQRSCSDLQNVAVMGHPYGIFIAIPNEIKNDWFELPHCPYLEKCTSVKLISYMTYFFAIGALKDKSNLCMFVQNEWRNVKELSGIGWLGVAVEDFVYLINSSNQRIKRFDPRLGNSLLESCIIFPARDSIVHVCSFDMFILAFCSEVINGVNKTAVYCLDTMSQSWTRLDSLEGSAENLVSFRKEKQLYILQTDGNLWEIIRIECKSLNLKLVEVLWDGYYELLGAVCKNDGLYIVVVVDCSDGDYDEDDKRMHVTSKLFSNIIIDEQSVSSSNIVPAVIKRSRC